MFTNADRREIDKLNLQIAAINDRLDIHAQLVEMNANLKAIREGLGGMTPEQEAVVNDVTDRLTKQAAEFDAAANEQSKSIQPSL